MCDEMNVIYEDGVENGLEVVVERLAEERDRITGELQKTRQEVIEYKQEVDDLERRIMMVKKTHLDKFPSTLQGLVQELSTAKEKMGEMIEEMIELKAERQNTRLLLEPLESLVMRHERSLRMTLGKRNGQNGAN